MRCSTRTTPPSSRSCRCAARLGNRGAARDRGPVLGGVGGRRLRRAVGRQNVGPARARAGRVCGPRVGCFRWRRFSAARRGGALHAPRSSAWGFGVSVAGPALTALTNDVAPPARRGGSRAVADGGGRRAVRRAGRAAGCSRTSRARRRRPSQCARWRQRVPWASSGRGRGLPRPNVSLVLCTRGLWCVRANRCSPSVAEVRLVQFAVAVQTRSRAPLSGRIGSRPRRLDSAGRSSFCHVASWPALSAAPGSVLKCLRLVVVVVVFEPAPSRGGFAGGSFPESEVRTRPYGRLRGLARVASVAPRPRSWGRSDLRKVLTSLPIRRTDSGKSSENGFRGPNKKTPSELPSNQSTESPGPQSSRVSKPTAFAKRCAQNRSVKPTKGL